jgi:hypothetical protein
MKSTEAKLHCGSVSETAEEPSILTLRWQDSEGKKKSDKSESNQKDSYCIERVPSPPLGFPIVWKAGNIPSFDAIIDGYRTEDAKNYDDDPENGSGKEKHCVGSRPSPSQPKQ